MTKTSMKRLSWTLAILLCLTGVPGIFTRPLRAEEEAAPEAPEALDVPGDPAIASLVRNRFESSHSEEIILSDTALQRIEAVPEILIDSEDARAANDELSRLADAIEELLDERSQSPEAEWAFTFNYSAVLRDELFSLCFRLEGVDPTESLSMGRYIYNFDLGTGQRLSDDALLAAWLGAAEDPSRLPLVREANIGHAAMEAAEEDQAYLDAMDEAPDDIPVSLRRGKILAGPLAYAAEGRVTGLEHALDEPQASRLFLDWVDGEALLSMVYAQYLDSRSPAIVMEKPVLIFPDERPLNPVYTELLAATGRADADAPEAEALVAFLGAAYDRQTIDELAQTLGAVEGQLDGASSPMPLLALSVDEEGRAVASLDQLFLIVPRNRDDAIEFALSELSEEGTLSPLAEDPEAVETWHQYGKGWSPMGIMTETYPTGLIRVMNLSEVGAWWAPSISGMDGSVIVPETALDLTDEVQKLIAEGEGGNAKDLEVRDLLDTLMPWVE